MDYLKRLKQDGYNFLERNIVMVGFIFGILAPILVIRFFLGK